jgi:hypothetical protein
LIAPHYSFAPHEASFALIGKTLMAPTLRPRRGRAAAAGTAEQERKPSRRSRGLGATVLALVAFLIGFFVAPRGPGGLVLASYHDQNLWALVPAGWKDEAAVAPFGTAKAAWFEISDPHDSETIQAALPAQLSPHARATARAAALRAVDGYVQGYLGPLTLAGGRQVWLLQYSLSGVDTAVFEFNACSPAIAMTVTADASSAGALATEEDAFAEGAEPVCDGPAFSNADRADLALPLALPS